MHPDLDDPHLFDCIVRHIEQIAANAKAIRTARLEEIQRCVDECDKENCRLDELAAPAEALAKLVREKLTKIVNFAHGKDEAIGVLEMQLRRARHQVEQEYLRQKANVSRSDPAAPSSSATAAATASTTTASAPLGVTAPSTPIAKPSGAASPSGSNCESSSSETASPELQAAIKRAEDAEKLLQEIARLLDKKEKEWTGTPAEADKLKRDIVRMKLALEEVIAGHSVNNAADPRVAGKSQ